MATLYKMVQEDAEYRKPLTDRQDADVRIRDLVAYIMYKADGTTPVEGVILRTLNRPKVMFNFIISALGKATERILVETEEKNLDLDYIRDFRRLSFEAADDKLHLQGGRGLVPYFIEQVCLRGGNAALPYAWMKNEKLIKGVTPWDYRYVNYEKGEEGLAWASYGYGTKRRAADIESAAWWDKRMNGVSLPSKEATIVDIQTLDHNEIWMDGKQVFEQEHNYKWPDGTRYVPVVIEPVSLGSQIADAEDIQNQSESVFFLIRQAIPELNRMASIIVTLAMEKLKPPATIKTVEGKTVPEAEMPTYDKAMAPGSIISADIEPINLGDANNAVLMANDIANKSMDEGGFIPRQLDPPQSGIAIILEKEGQDVVNLPRLETIALTRQGLGDMATAQMIQIGGAVEIGAPGHERSFETNKLKGQYKVTHKFTVRSLATDAGLASLAASYGEDLPRHYKLREIYQVDDPEEIERWLRYEEAERLSPGVKRLRTIEALIESDEEREAEIMSEEAGLELEQVLSGEVAPLEPEEKKEPTQVVSLFGGGQGRAQQPPAGEG